jgi:hypothetical protein
MKYLQLLAALLVPSVAGFSFNAWDMGFHGIYPRQRFHSVDFEAPAPKITQWDSRCNSGNLLLTPRGPFVSGRARGPVMLDAQGNLVWMNNGQFEQVINLDVQKYKGEDYLTFWHKANKGEHKGRPKKSFVMVISSCWFLWTLMLIF